MSATPSNGPLRSFEDVLAAQLEDPAFRAEWTRLAPARSVALRLVGYRLEHGLTQTALGRRLGMPQPAVARLEAADHLPSFDTLLRLAEALDIEFRIDIKPGPTPSAWVTPEAQRAAVVQHVTTAGGGALLVAAG